jgi:hypothetical protein
MLENKSADQLVTKSGVNVVDIQHIPFARSTDNEYAVRLEGFSNVFLYNAEGVCTEGNNRVGDDSLDLIVK